MQPPVFLIANKFQNLIKNLLWYIEYQRLKPDQLLKIIQREFKLNQY